MLDIFQGKFFSRVGAAGGEKIGEIIVGRTLKAGRSISGEARRDVRRCFTARPLSLLHLTSYIFLHIVHTPPAAYLLCTFSRHPLGVFG